MIVFLSFIGNSLVVQWLGLHAPTARSPGSIPGEGTKIPQAMQSGPKKKVLKSLKIFNLLVSAASSIMIKMEA